MTQTHDLPPSVHDVDPPGTVWHGPSYEYAAPSEPARPARGRRGGTALLLIACLGAGATGAGSPPCCKTTAPQPPPRQALPERSRCR